MRGQKRAFIVDFDNTLIDTDAIKSSWLALLKKKYGINKSDFLIAYKKSKTPTGYLDIIKLSKLLKVTKDFFYKTHFNKYLFSGVTKDLVLLQKMGKVILLSTGDTYYQPEKIKKSGIEKIVGKSSVIITQDKKQSFTDLITKLKSAGYTHIFFIDDIARQLVEARRVFSKGITIWVRYGKYKNMQPVLQSSISSEVESFSEAVAYIKRFISVINIKKSHMDLSILEGIECKQIQNLITYTKIDLQIKKFTNDRERFKNSKTFSTWKSRNKIIYTLVDKHSKLLGIIWFSKKKYKKISYTFAIRIYKPVRGKGLARKFMDEVFRHFAEKYSKEIWLKSHRDNDIAFKLYKSYGFKEVERPIRGEVVMTYKIKGY